MLSLIPRRAIIVLVAVLAACGEPKTNVASVEAPIETGATHELADGWFEARPEPGLSLRLREGWNANRAEDGKGPIVFIGPDSARVMVWPMFVAKGADMPAPETVLTAFAQTVASEFAWSAPSKFQSNGVRMFGNAGGNAAQASFLYSTSEAGMAGFWYLASAPRDQYASLQPVFAQIMEGVRIYGPGAGAEVASSAQRAMQFVEWREPNEGAYTAQVPKGWNVKGGIVRPDPMRLLDVMEMISDDGDVYVFSGDLELPLFKTITQMERQLGMSEGMNNGSAILMHYIPAAEYLPNYIQNRFGPQCGGVKIDGVEDQRELSGPINAQLAANTAPGSFQQADVAAASFQCGSGAIGVIQMGTYITGTTSQYGSEGFGIWQVSGVGGFVAPKERASEATEAVIKMLTAREVSPQWRRANGEMISQIQTMSRQAADQLSADIAGRYSPATSSSTSSSSTVNSLDDLSRRWENSILDQTDVVDQASGRTYKVESGSNYYWINQQGTAIAGTDAPSQPSTDFSQMVELP